MPKKAKKKKEFLEFDINLGGAGITQRGLFAKHLAVMLKSGLTITEALSVVYDSAQGRFKKIIGGVVKSVQSGNSFSSSLALYPKVFSGLFISATQAGELSGTLEENLENISEQLRKEKELISKVKGAMLYPVVVFIAAFCLGLVMAFVVLPKITPMLEGLRIKLPVTTRALIWFSHLIQHYGLYIFLGLIAVIILLAWLVKQKISKPVTHWLLLNIPILKRITFNSNLARICSTLATLLKSGLNIDEALEITKNTLNNYYYRKSLGHISEQVSKGTRLSDNLNQYKKLYPVMVIRMIGVGEKSGRLDETLKYLANYHEFKVDNATKTLTTAIEPILLIFIGLAVGFLALSIITPIYEVTGGIKR